MTRQLIFVLILIWAVAVAFAACDDTGTDGDGDGDSDTDVDSDSDGDSDSDTGPTWTHEVVNPDEAGQFSSLDVGPTGTVAVAYYGFRPEIGPDCDVLGDVIPENRYALYYSYLDPGAAAWETETVTKTLHLAQPNGLSFRFAPNGTPTIATFGGEAIDVLCSANDSVLASRGPDKTWSLQTVATDSSGATPAADDDCPLEAATKGYAVGAWPALAFSKTGETAVMYRDNHFWNMQRDDILRADAEVVFPGGGGAMMVDCGDGGGRDNSAVYDSEDRFVGFHRITQEANAEDRHGLWAHRLEADDTWSVFMLVAGQVGFGERSVVGGDGGPRAVAYYDPRVLQPYLAELVEPAQFADGGGWIHDDAIGDTRYDEGRFPVVARHPDGRIAMAYYRCTRSGSSGTACEDDHDAVVFAWRNAAGSWTREVIDEGSRGQCGTNISLAFDADGVAWVSYVCVRNPSGSDFFAELKVAHRRPL